MEMAVNMVEKREIFGNDFGSPFKVKLTGGRCFFIALGTIMAMFAAYGVVGALNDANELKRAELDILRQRLDVAKHQYTLDSLKYFGNQKIR